MQVLLDVEESKKRRLQDETQIQLERIRARVSFTLNKYEEKSRSSELDTGESKKDHSVTASLEHISDPKELYDLLSDAHMRSKYEKHLMVVMVRIESTADAREQILASLEDFFVEVQASNTDQVIQEVAAQEIDLEEATKGVESALKTAMNSANRLMEIKKEISQLLAVAAAFPDTKKGRKKLEKALVTAQDEVQELTSNLQQMKEEMEKNKTKYEQLQKQLEAKAADALKLKKQLEQIKKLEASNSSLEGELNRAKSSLKNVQDELEVAKRKPVNEPVLLKVDEGRVKELEEALKQATTINEQLRTEKEELVQEHHKELDKLVAQNEEEMMQMRTEHEDQLHSLVMDTDVFDDNEEQDTEGEREEVDSEEPAHDLEPSITALSEPSPGDLEEPAGTPISHTLALSPTPSLDINHGESLGQKTWDTKERDEQIEQAAMKVNEIKREEGENVNQFEIEAAKKEAVLKTELAEVKAHSRKMMTSLKAQLVDANNKLEQERTAHAKEQTRLADMLLEEQTQSKSLQSLKMTLTKTIESLQQEGEKMRSTITDQAQLIHHLQQELQSAQTTRQDESEPPLAINIATRSTQWSEMASESHKSISQSIISEPPLLSMQELPCSPEVSSSLGEPSAAQMSSVAQNMLMSSMDNQPHGSPLYAVSSAGTPLQAPTDHPTLSALSHFSRLSQHSEGLSPSHPAVQEWNKAYEQVMKFKESVVILLQGHTHIPEVADIVTDLDTLPDLALGREADVTGKLTQMRFSLALTLHQLESALQTCLAPSTEDVAAESPTTSPSEEEEVRKIRVRVALLQQQLQHSEDRNRAELRKSKDTIANLSTKVEGLKAELNNLRQHFSQQRTVNNTTIFFTRLDTERNERALQGAVDSQHIEEKDYQQISSQMSQYLDIPSQRLVQFSQHLQQHSQTKAAIGQVRKVSPSPEHADRVLGLIQQMQEHRQQEFKATMRQLSAKRLELAQSLQRSLSHVERTAGVFLIKPIYPSGPQLPRSLVVPVNRKPPRWKAPTSSLSLPHSPPTRAAFKRTASAHPAMRLISALHSSASSRQQQYGELPHSTQTLPAHIQVLAEDEETKWSVSSSRVQSAAGQHSYSPVLPRLVELETIPLREPGLLLGHLTSSRPSSKARQQLSSLVSAHERARTLPPIHLPSQLEEAISC